MFLASLVNNAFWACTEFDSLKNYGKQTHEIWKYTFSHCESWVEASFGHTCLTASPAALR